MTVFFLLLSFLGCSGTVPETVKEIPVVVEERMDSASEEVVDDMESPLPQSDRESAKKGNSDSIPVPQPAEMSLGLQPYRVPVPSWMTPPPVPQDNPLTHAGVALGRHLFYDPMLSGNNTQSCASCHQQRFSFTDGKRVSVGSEGREVDRNAMALVNLAWTAPYFWDGRIKTLEELVPIPIADPDELNQDLDALVEELSGHPDYSRWFELAFPTEGLTKETISKAIAQFLRTLVSFNSRADQLNAGLISLTPLEQRGNQLMIDGFPKGSVDAVPDLCDKCHLHSAGVRDGGQDMGLFTDSSFKSNGLAVTNSDIGRQKVTGLEEDRGRFIVPTIRNLTVTAPYMHDGRLKTIEDVVSHYAEGIRNSPQLESPLSIGGKAIRMKLDESDKKAIVAIMAIFTDEGFLTNPAFSNPHD